MRAWTLDGQDQRHALDITLSEDCLIVYGHF